MVWRKTIKRRQKKKVFKKLYYSTLLITSQKELFLKCKRYSKTPKLFRFEKSSLNSFLKVTKLLIKLWSIRWAKHHSRCQKRSKVWPIYSRFICPQPTLFLISLPKTWHFHKDNFLSVTFMKDKRQINSKENCIKLHFQEVYLQKTKVSKEKSIFHKLVWKFSKV